MLRAKQNIKWWGKMLITSLVLLFGLQQRANCISVKIKHTNLTDNKDVEFVDLLKKDLRRNNDDYIDKMKNSKLGGTVHNKQSGTGNMAKSNVKEQFSDNISTIKPNQMVLGKDTYRRKLDFSDEIDYNKYSFSPATVTSNPSIAVPTINPKRFLKVSISTEPDQHAPLQPIASSENYPNYLKQGKIEKFKQFMDKNKGLIQDFIVNKKREGAQTTEPMPTLEASLEGGDEKVAQRARASEERLRAIPGPRLLDMSPAKGGRIHAMRLKGRLCERHVLVPEGPKYDSKGHVYLPAFARRGRDYHQTRPPKQLLPKCCNCCRKSVLGCE